MHAAHQTSEEPSRDGRAKPHEAVAFTNRGLRVLDELATVLVHRMATTPDGIAHVLDHVLHAPLDELCQALQVVADGIEERTYRADKPARAGVVYADGWRTQMPGSWPYYPDEPHRCHTVGHWTRDGEHLVLACCGLEQRPYETENGEKRHAWEITADDIGVSLRHATARPTKTQRPGQDG